MVLGNVHSSWLLPWGRPLDSWGSSAVNLGSDGSLISQFYMFHIHIFKISPAITNIIVLITTAIKKLTRYWLGGKVGALSHWGRSNFCGCGNNFIFHSFFSPKKLRLGHASALTLEFIYMLGMKLTAGDIAAVLDFNINACNWTIYFLYCYWVTYSQFLRPRLHEGRDLFSPWPSRLVKSNINHRCLLR